MGHPEQPVLIWGNINDSVARGVRVDSSAHAIVSIEYDHHEVHEGSSFVVTDVQNVDSTSMQWMITTPNTTKYAHMIFDIHGTGELQAVLTEGADRTGTNALTVINRRRVGTPTAATVTVHRVVSGGATDGATTIFSLRAGATGGGNKTVSTGGHRGMNEYILKPDTKYIVTITTYANIYVSFHIVWYEHTDRN